MSHHSTTMRNDTLHAVLTTGAGGAPVRSIAQPMADVTDVHPRGISAPRTLGLTAGIFALLTLISVLVAIDAIGDALLAP